MTMYLDSSPQDTLEAAVDLKPAATASNKLPVDVAERLLDKLSTDDAFRDLFVADIRAAMREIGYETPAEILGVPGSDPIVCFGGPRLLASKESLAAARARLVSSLSHAPFHFAVRLA